MSDHVEGCRAWWVDRALKAEVEVERLRELIKHSEYRECSGDNGACPKCEAILEVLDDD